MVELILPDVELALDFASALVTFDASFQVTPGLGYTSFVFNVGSEGLEGY